jgi:TRAP-type C4-dicarboxylate transport system substrate-binding protein
MWKKSIAVLLLTAILGVSLAAARPIVIKLGSAAPDNSIWADSLKELANEWNEISDGQIWPMSGTKSPTVRLK